MNQQITPRINHKLCRPQHAPKQIDKIAFAACAEIQLHRAARDQCCSVTLHILPPCGASTQCPQMFGCILRNRETHRRIVSKSDQILADAWINRTGSGGK